MAVETGDEAACPLGSTVAVTLGSDFHIIVFGPLLPPSLTVALSLPAFPVGFMFLSVDVSAGSVKLQATVKGRGVGTPNPFLFVILMVAITGVSSSVRGMAGVNGLTMANSLVASGVVVKELTSTR